MNPGDSWIVPNCSFGSSILNRCRWSHWFFPVTSSVHVEFCIKKLINSKSICFINCVFSSEVNFSLPLISVPISDQLTHIILSILVRRYRSDLSSALRERSISVFRWEMHSNLIDFILLFSFWLMRVRPISFFLHFQIREMINVLVEIFSRNLHLSEMHNAV